MSPLPTTWVFLVPRVNTPSSFCAGASCKGWSFPAWVSKVPSGEARASVERLPRPLCLFCPSMQGHRAKARVHTQAFAPHPGSWQQPSLSCSTSHSVWREGTYKSPGEEGPDATPTSQTLPGLCSARRAAWWINEEGRLIDPETAPNKGAPAPAVRTTAVKKLN